MVNNKSTDDKCVACTTSKPGSTAGLSSAPSISSGQVCKYENAALNKLFETAKPKSKNSPSVCELHSNHS